MRRWRRPSVGHPPAGVVVGVLGLALSALAGCGTFSDPPDTAPPATPTTIKDGGIDGSSPSSTEPASDGDTPPPTTGSGVPPPLAAGTGLLLRSDLTGESVDPGPGDPDGGARLIVTSDGHDDEVCYSLEVDSLGPVQALHIHSRPGGGEEPVADLTNPATASSRGCLAVDAAVMAAIARSAGDYYVDVHTADLPQGAVGGKLNP